MATKDSWTVLAEHCVETLPDTLSGQKELLRALSRVLAEDHPLMPIVRAKLAAHQALDNLQQEFRLMFGEGVKS